MNYSYSILIRDRIEDPSTKQESVIQELHQKLSYALHERKQFERKERITKQQFDELKTEVCFCF